MSGFGEAPSHSVGPADAESLSTSFREIGNSLAAAGSVDNTLSMIVDLAESVIEGCDSAGIFVLERGVVTTLHHSDQIVFEYDGLQNRYGEGPCLDALHQNQTFYAEDLADDDRWPYFGPPATAAGLRSVLALPLTATGPPTALNLYAELPRAFGALDRARGLLLAAFSSVALSSARVHRDDELLASNLHDALASREIIGQAQGILIERERITPEQAFNMLRSASQHLNVKLRDVAQALVDTGENPETGRRWSAHAAPAGPGPEATQPKATPPTATPAEAVPPEPTPPAAT